MRRTDEVAAQISIELADRLARHRLAIVALSADFSSFRKTEARLLQRLPPVREQDLRCAGLIDDEDEVVSKLAHALCEPIALSLLWADSVESGGGTSSLQPLISACEQEIASLSAVSEPEIRAALVRSCDRLRALRMLLESTALPPETRSPAAPMVSESECDSESSDKGPARAARGRARIGLGKRSALAALVSGATIVFCVLRIGASLDSPIRSANAAEARVRLDAAYFFPAATWEIDLADSSPGPVWLALPEPEDAMTAPNWIEMFREVCSFRYDLWDGTYRSVNGETIFAQCEAAGGEAARLGR